MEGHFAITLFPSRRNASKTPCASRDPYPRPDSSCGTEPVRCECEPLSSIRTRILKLANRDSRAELVEGRPLSAASATLTDHALDQCNSHVYHDRQGLENLQR